MHTPWSLRPRDRDIRDVQLSTLEVKHRTDREVHERSTRELRERNERLARELRESHEAPQRDALKVAHSLSQDMELTHLKVVCSNLESKLDATESVQRRTEVARRRAVDLCHEKERELEVLTSMLDEGSTRIAGIARLWRAQVELERAARQEHQRGVAHAKELQGLLLASQRDVVALTSARSEAKAAEIRSKGHIRELTDQLDTLKEQAATLQDERNSAVARAAQLETDLFVTRSLSLARALEEKTEPRGEDAKMGSFMQHMDDDVAHIKDDVTRMDSAVSHIQEAVAKLLGAADVYLRMRAHDWPRAASGVPLLTARRTTRQQPLDPQ